MDDTLTGAISSGHPRVPGTGAANPAAARSRDVKGKWTLLGSATALCVALGAVLQQGAGLSQAITDLVHKISPQASEWTEDEAVVIEPDKNIRQLTILVCDSGSESGESMHIAFLLGKDKSTLPPAFVLKKKACPGEKGRVWMNPDDFENYITQPLKADFKLSYSRAHLDSLDQLVTSALNLCNPGTSVNQTSGGH